MAAALLTGCAGQTLAAAPTPAPSRSSATATPTTTPTSTPTPTPTASSTVAPENAETIAPVTPVAPEPAPQPAPSSDPPPAPEPVDPNSVDNADYVSYAWDAGNNNALTGVSFTVAGGRIICGISDGATFPMAGTASCTPDTYREIISQPVPEGPAYVMSVVIDPVVGPSGLYPDWFAQPARAIPALPEGRNIRLGGTTCTAERGGVRCDLDANGKGFFLDIAGYSYH